MTDEASTDIEEFSPPSEADNAALEIGKRTDRIQFWDYVYSPNSNAEELDQKFGYPSDFDALTKNFSPTNWEIESAKTNISESTEQEEHKISIRSKSKINTHIELRSFYINPEKNPKDQELMAGLTQDSDNLEKGKRKVYDVRYTSTQPDGTVLEGRSIKIKLTEQEKDKFSRKEDTASLYEFLSIVTPNYEQTKNITGLEPGKTKIDKINIAESNYNLNLAEEQPKASINQEASERLKRLGITKTLSSTKDLPIQTLKHLIKQQSY